MNALGWGPYPAVSSMAERWSLNLAHRGGSGNDSHVFLVFLSGRLSHVKDIQVDLSGVTKRLRTGGFFKVLDSPFPCHQLRDCKWGRAALELVARTSVGRSESRKKKKGGKKRKIAKKGEG